MRDRLHRALRSVYSLENILLVFVCMWTCGQVAVAQSGRRERHTVCFGKHIRHKAPANAVRIFLDKDGNYYPDIFIRDNELRHNNSSLGEWYRNNTSAFNSLCTAYKVPVSTFEQQLAGLNDALAKQIAERINTGCHGFDIVDVSIHGFSKKAYGFRIVDRLATGDNRKLEQALQAGTKKKLFFVEIYWDSKFINMFSAAHKGKGYYIFKEGGIPNAMRVGLSLRKVVSAIRIPQLNIITHSLSTVACALLFNADSTDPVRQWETPTPKQLHTRLCMIAPAMGATVFSNYYSRDSTVSAPYKDNYEIAVVYNTNDVVLNKKLQVLWFRIMDIGAEAIAATTLGCNYKNDLALLRQKVAPNEVKLFDLSYRNGRKQKCHYLNHCYIRNKACFADVVDWLNR